MSPVKERSWSALGGAASTQPSAPTLSPAHGGHTHACQAAQLQGTPAKKVAPGDAPAPALPAPRAPFQRGRPGSRTLAGAPSAPAAAGGGQAGGRGHAAAPAPAAHGPQRVLRAGILRRGRDGGTEPGPHAAARVPPGVTFGGGLREAVLTARQKTQPPSTTGAGRTGPPPEPGGAAAAELPPRGRSGTRSPPPPRGARTFCGGLPTVIST